jgi:hypothetical protein
VSPDPVYPVQPSIGQLSQIISQCAAPASLLGALAAFIAILISRLTRVIERTIVLNAIPDDGTVKRRLKTDLLRLMRRTAEPRDLLGDYQQCKRVLRDSARAWRRYPVYDSARRFHCFADRLCTRVRIALSEFDHHT